MTETPLRIITSGAQAAAIEAALPFYDAPVEIAYGSSLGAAHDSIPTRLAAGERFDLYFLAQSGKVKYAAQGFMNNEFIPLVESHIAAAVREGDEVPDISTTESFRAVLMAAGSVAHAASASGIYLSNDVFPALGIADEMSRTARTIFSERVGRVVARGEADLGFQQLSELIPIEGITIVGRLPEEFRRPFVFGAALGLDPERRPAAEAFLEFLRSDAGAEAFRASGLDPVR